MRWVRENRGYAAVSILAVIVLAAFAAFLVQGLRSDAEAVIGGQGNLSGANHPHNLSASSNYARATTEDQICVFCHTPHRALVTETSGAKIINAPLWNHELSSATYTVKSQYLTPTYNATLANTLALLSVVTSQPDGASRLCLSCHDGTVSVGAVYHRYGYSESSNDISMVDACLGTGGGEVAGLGFDLSTPSRFGALTSACMAYIGTDLRTKHVVSVAMNDDLISATLYNCTAPDGVGTATMKLQYPWDGGYGTTVLLRPTAQSFNGNPGVTRTGGQYKSGYNYGVQCSTCHDPHYWVNDVNAILGDVTGERMLVEPFNILCAACHRDCNT